MVSPAVREVLTGPLGLATRLRSLRASSGQSARALADQLGWADYRVSKLENGRQMPTAEDVARWVEACDGEALEAERLEDLRRQAVAHHRDWWGRSKGAEVIAGYLELARATTVFQLFELETIPGILQTADYCHAVQSTLASEVGSTPEETAEKVRIRMEAARLVYDAHRQFRVILGEGALRYWYTDGPAMRAQLAHLSVLAGLPNVDLAVTPFGARLPTLLYNAFALYDGLAVVETREDEGTYQPSERQAKLYAEVWPRLWAQSLTGEAARGRIQAIANGIEIDPEGA